MQELLDDRNDFLDDEIGRREQDVDTEGCVLLKSYRKVEDGSSYSSPFLNAACREVSTEIES